MKHEHQQIGETIKQKWNNEVMKLCCLNNCSEI